MCAHRIAGFGKPTIWTKLSEISAKLNAMDLGQGFPNWNPPKFLVENLQKAEKEGMSFQYSRAYGDLDLENVISEFYSPLLKKKLYPSNNICVTEGASSALFSSIIGLVNPGDEVVVLEPAYDCYMAQVQMAGGKYIGGPLIPPKPLTKEELKGRFSANGHFEFKRENDSFKIDFEKLKENLTNKTKLLIMNSPHNPTGKIFTFDEFSKLSSLLKEFPQIKIVSDEVYEFNLYEDIKELPRIASVEGLYERTISVYSAGKTFSATGIRIGMAVGPEDLISSVKAVHQYSSFCIFKPLQQAVAESYRSHIINPLSTYKKDLVDQYRSNRNLLLKSFSDSSLNFKFYIPEAGYFLILDIEDLEYPDSYKEENETNDIGCSTFLANEKKVVFIPLSVFYSEQTKKFGKNYIRAAFCKTPETIKMAAENIK